jgi:hypothetical protein
MNHFLVITAIEFVLNGNMRDVEFVQKDFMYFVLDFFGLADPDVIIQIDVTFEMDFIIVKVHAWT